MAKAPNAMEQEMTTKFMDMIKSFKGKAEQLVGEINTAHGTNMGNAVKNYLDIQKTYLEGYNGVTGGAKNANSQLLDSFDKNYNELKKRILESHDETKSKAGEALDTSTKDFKTMCEEAIKKMPSLPENLYKDVVKFLDDSKKGLNGNMDKEYTDVIKALDKNYQETRKQLTLPDIKEPKLPSLDVGHGLLDTAKAKVTGMMEKASQKFEEVKPQIQNAAADMTAQAKAKMEAVGASAKTKAEEMVAKKK